MKMNAVHIVPLAARAVEILQEIQPLTGAGKYVFPCARTTAHPMSEMRFWRLYGAWDTQKTK